MDVDEEIEVDVTKGRLKTKGRGHRARQDGNDSEIGRGGVFESIDSAKGAPRPRGDPRAAMRKLRAAGGPVKSVEGWIARRPRLRYDAAARARPSARAARPPARRPDARRRRSSRRTSTRRRRRRTSSTSSASSAR